MFEKISATSRLYNFIGDATALLYNSVDLKLVRILLKIHDIIFLPDNYDYRNSTRETLLHLLHLISFFLFEKKYIHIFIPFLKI